MSFSKISAFAGAIMFASKVAAHGTVSGIVADGVYYLGYNPSFQHQAVAPVVVGWSIPEDKDNGFVAPSAFDNPDIICHKGATNAQTSATVAAGGTIELQWTTWPSSHKGPMIGYLANCNGDCTTIDKTTLVFFKIDEAGLIDGTTAPGTWASDQMIANNNTWVTTIPSDITPGNYVLRHETIALHSAGSADGAQSYPQCINLKITGSGTAKPSGVLGTALMTATDPGILISIYQSLISYKIPGPALYSSTGSSSQTGSSSARSAASAVVQYSAASSSTVFPTKFTVTTSVATQVRETGTPSPIIESMSVIPIPATNSSPVSSATSVSAPEATGSSNKTASAIPADTTLNQVLSWISSFYSTHGEKSYTEESSISRRHARDIIA